jgi:hypothetical protein
MHRRERGGAAERMICRGLKEKVMVISKSPWQHNLNHSSMDKFKSTFCVMTFDSIVVFGAI